MNLSRRDFLKTSTIAGGGLLLGFHLPNAFAAAVVHTPNAWVHIGDDNTITLFSARSEMGQGVYTSMPMLIAEELNVDLASVKVAIAPPDPIYVNALLGAQITGGSTSVRDGWEKLRVAGAQVRAMLITAAAGKWNVDGKDCRAEKGVVIGPGGRRATYGELAAAAAKLPVPTDVPLKEPKDFTIVGKRVKRLDTPAKVNGTAEFGLDVKLPGMVYASIEQCPVIGGKVRSFDAAKAKSMPGVIDVVQVDDGVAVVANSTWRARKAREKLTVQWDEGPGAKLSTDSMLAGIRAAQDGAKSISIKKTGDASAALARAATTMKAEYVSPLLAHATLEPMNFTAQWQGGKCLLIGPTQFQQGAQGAVAAALGLKPEDVTLQTTFLGGGFGRRIELDFIVQAAQISKAVGKPVKLTWTREDDMTHDFYRPMSLHRLSAGLDTEGRPTALTFQLTSQSVTERAFPPFAPPGAVDPFMVESAVVPYSIPNLTHDLIRHDSGFRLGYWRSVSHALNAFANESFIDELAAAGKKDPYAYRLSLLDQKPRLAAVLKQAAEKAGWGRPLPAGHTRGIALLDSEGYNMCMAEVAEISVEKGVIKVHRMVAAADIGRMVNPDIVEAQIRSGIIFGLSAALHGEITLANGRVQQGNFNNYAVMRMNDSPQIDVVLIDSTEKPGGIGEPSTALVAPAVANALFAATGQRVRRLPLTPANIAKA